MTTTHTMLTNETESKQQLGKAVQQFQIDHGLDDADMMLLLADELGYYAKLIKHTGYPPCSST